MSRREGGPASPRLRSGRRSEAHSAKEGGLTLLEVMVASVIALFVLFGIGSMDVGRVRMENELRLRSSTSSEQGKVPLAALSLTKALERADRIRIIDTGITASTPFTTANLADIQIRTFDPTTACGTGCTGAGVIPDPCCFDIPANYRWDEYKRDAGANEIWLYRDAAAGCVKRVLAGEATEMTAEFRDQAAAPPGGDPAIGGQAGADNNTIEFRIRWSNGTDSQDFKGQVTSRAIPYTNVGTSLGNSGWGQASSDIGPPASCP